MKLYDLVKFQLTIVPYLRDDDKMLIWEIWHDQGFTHNGYLEFGDFLKATSPESIRRCRQKIQENFPELRGSERVKKARNKIADQKGTHVYREIFTKKVPTNLSLLDVKVEEDL